MALMSLRISLIHRHAYTFGPIVLLVYRKLVFNKYNYITYFSKQIYKTPYLRNVISIQKCLPLLAVVSISL